MSQKTLRERHTFVQRSGQLEVCRRKANLLLEPTRNSTGSVVMLLTLRITHRSKTFGGSWHKIIAKVPRCKVSKAHETGNASRNASLCSSMGDALCVKAFPHRRCRCQLQTSTFYHADFNLFPHRLDVKAVCSRRQERLQLASNLK